MENSKESDFSTDQESFDSVQLKFLIEQHFKEVSHFWTRTNVFLVTNIAAFGAVLSNIYSEYPISFRHQVAISILGFIFCGIWYFINRIAVYYEKRWLVDAKRLAESNPRLKSTFYISLGFRENRIKEEEKYEWLDDQFFDLKRPGGLSATSWMSVIIVLFGFGWIYLVVGNF